MVNAVCMYREGGIDNNQSYISTCVLCNWQQGEVRHPAPLLSYAQEESGGV